MARVMCACVACLFSAQMMASKKELAIVSFHLPAKSKNDNSPVDEVLIFTHLAVSLGSCRPALLPFVIIVQGMEYLLRRSGKTGVSGSQNTPVHCSNGRGYFMGGNA